MQNFRSNKKHFRQSMSTSTSNIVDPMTIKQEAIHQPDVSLPDMATTSTTSQLTTNTNINTNTIQSCRDKMVLDDDSTEDEEKKSNAINPTKQENNNNNNNNNNNDEDDDISKPLDPTGMRIPKKQRHEIPPPVLEHKLMVKSSDGRIANLLCPIELVLEAKKYSAPLIPHGYEPAIFCMFQNVNNNCYVASTPKITTRKRKNENSSNHKNPAKKRKKSQSISNSSTSSRNNNNNNNKSSSPRNKGGNRNRDRDRDRNNRDRDNEDIDLGKIPKKHGSHRIDDDDYFGYQPGLNVNSRPKRQRKKVSYREPDPAQIPINYIPTKQTTTTKKQTRATRQHNKSQSMQKGMIFINQCRINDYLL